MVDGLGDGVLLEAPDSDFDFIRNTSFNLLQGCRMRNTKTVIKKSINVDVSLAVFDLRQLSSCILHCLRSTCLAHHVAELFSTFKR